MASYKYEEVYIDMKNVTPQQEIKKLDQPPIILLHGLSSSKETWEEVMQPLADRTGREVFALDARNHGDSDWSANFNTDVIAEDVLRFMHKRNLPKAVIVGHSFGGRAALKFALNEPKLVEKLVVEDISAKRSSYESRSSVRDYLKSVQELIEKLPPSVDDIKEAKRILNEQICKMESKEETTRGTEKTNGFYLGIKKREDGKFVWKANIEFLEKFMSENFSSIPNHPLTREFDGLCEKPVLFLYGTKSSFNVQKDEDFIKKLFPKAVLKGVEAGHQIHLSLPEKFLEEVAKFLNDN